MVTQNSIMHLLVGKDINRTASVTATDPSASTYAVTGEMVVTDMSGTVLNTTTVQGVDKIKIVQSQGATLPSIQSPIIELIGVKSYRSKAYTAPTVQVDYIGYDTSSSSLDIDVANSTNYEIKIHDLNSYNWGSIGTDIFGMYVSDATATKCEITDGLAVNLSQNSCKLVQKPFIVERVNSATTGTNTGTVTLAAVNGSTVVTVSGGTAATDSIVVGGYVKFSATATVTGKIYKVVAIDSTGIYVTLDQQYQGSSASFTAGNACVYTAAQLNSGSAGIKLTGQACVFSNIQGDFPYVNRWNTNLVGFTSTVVTNTTAGTEGSGSYPYMAKMEWELLGNEGFISRNDFPFVTPRANILSTGTYHILSLEWNSVAGGQIFNQQGNAKQLLMAFDGTAGALKTNVTGAITSIQDVLNVWISSAIGTGTLS